MVAAVGRGDRQDRHNEHNGLAPGPRELGPLHSIASAAIPGVARAERKPESGAQSVPPALLGAAF